jgi:hypothetical protein
MVITNIANYLGKGKPSQIFNTVKYYNNMRKKL